MHRRDLLKAAAAAPFALSVQGTLLAAGRAAFHRVRPSDPSWPPPETWERLKRRVGGRLLRPRPLFADCRDAPKGPACLEALGNLANPFYIGDQPAGTEVSGWLDAWSPAPSAFVVAAQSASDVAEAVNFARENRLRLVVKGTGHSYQGTSNAPDSLMIWTRAMNEVILHDAFVPKGCDPATAPVAAVTVGGGIMGIDAYDAVTTKAGRYVQGGGCTTVGLAGLIQSGGFGSFSKQFGMASASLLEARIVTADGVLRTVNACRGADLFWALNSGGGGSWGVIISLTLRTHALPDFFGGAEATIKASSDDAYRRLIDRFVAFYAQSLFNPHWGESVHIRPDNRLNISMVCSGLKYSEATAVWRPFFDWVAASPADYAFTEKPDVGTTLARGCGTPRRGESADRPR